MPSYGAAVSGVHSRGYKHSPPNSSLCVSEAQVSGPFGLCAVCELRGGAKLQKSRGDWVLT